MAGHILYRENGMVKFKEKFDKFDKTTIIHVNYMGKLKATILLLFLSLLSFLVIMYRYSIIQLRQESVHVYLGSTDITINFVKPSKFFDNLSNELTNKSHYTTKKFSLLFWSDIYQQKSYMDEFTRGKCSEKYKISSNKSDLKHADAVVIHINYPDNIPWNKIKTIPRILDLDNGIDVNKKLKKPTFMKKFNYFIGPSNNFDFFKPVHINDNFNNTHIHGALENKTLAIFNSCNQSFIELIQKTKQYCNILMINNCEKGNILQNNKGGINFHRVSQLLNMTKFHKYAILITKECFGYPDKMLSMLLHQTFSNIMLYGTINSTIESIPLQSRQRILFGNNYNTPESLGQLLNSKTFSQDTHRNKESLTKNSTSLLCKIIMKLKRDKNLENIEKYSKPTTC